MKSKIVLLFVLLTSAGVPADVSTQSRDPDTVPEGLAKTDWQSIRAAYEAGRYAFQPTATGWQARNPGQQWTTTFDRRGFLAQPRDGEWQWGLELQSYGWGEKQTAIGGTPSVKSDGQRFSCQWDAIVQEWFVNDQRGLEHGFTVARRPAEIINHQSQITNPLSLTLRTRGTLHPVISADAQGVLFKDAGGGTVLNYTGLKVWDADGKILPSRFVIANSQLPTLNSQPVLSLLVEDAGARYPITIDPLAQQAFLKPAAVGTTQVNDSFGWSVAVSGDTVVVGALGEDSSTTGVNSTPDEAASNAGAAYVFVRSGGAWTQQAYLKPASVGTSQVTDQFGISVAISGDTVVVGASLEDSNTTGVNSTPNDTGGSNVNAGAVYVFVRNAGVWTQQAFLKPAAFGTSQDGDIFGNPVAISGDTIVVGATGEDSSTTGVNSTPEDTGGPNINSGAAYVFVRNAEVWTQQAYLKPAAVGTTQAGDNFGASVGVSGDTIVVGAYNEDSSTVGVNSTPNESAAAAGAAYVFARSAGVWTQQAYLKPAAVGSSQADDKFGWSAAISGDTVIVGAYGEDSNTTGVNSTPTDVANLNAGAAYLFVGSGGVWTQEAYLKPGAFGTTQSNDSFGWSVAISGDTAVVGATTEDSNTTGVNSTPVEGSPDSGAAYVFVRGRGQWIQQAYLKPAAVGSSQTDDHFGSSVAVSGDTVVAGAEREKSSTTGVNPTPNESAARAGAAFVLTGFGPVPEIVVEHPVGTSLPAGTGSIDFGPRPADSPGTAKVITIRNVTAGNLNLAAPAVTGGNAGDFNVNTAGTLLVIPAFSQTTFSITFNPGSTFSPTVSSARGTTLHIANDDEDESSFDIALNGTGLIITADADSDGLNDVAEFNLSALGLDWQVPQPALVSALSSGAESAGLYTTAQVQALHADVPLIQRHPVTGVFTFTFGLQKSTTLTPGSFLQFPFTQTGTTINGAGRIEFQFTSPDNAAFFRLEPP